jgi:hypothetical protein
MPDEDDNETEDAPGPAAAAPNPGIDLEELARKIFELLLREIQLENERTGR